MATRIQEKISLNKILKNKVYSLVKENVIQYLANKHGKILFDPINDKDKIKLLLDFQQMYYNTLSEFMIYRIFNDTNFILLQSSSRNYYLSVDLIDLLHKDRVVLDPESIKKLGVEDYIFLQPNMCLFFDDKVKYVIEFDSVITNNGFKIETMYFTLLSTEDNIKKFDKRIHWLNNVIIPELLIVIRPYCSLYFNKSQLHHITHFMNHEKKLYKTKIKVKDDEYKLYIVGAISTIDNNNFIPKFEHIIKSTARVINQYNDQLLLLVKDFVNLVDQFRNKSDSK